MELPKKAKGELDTALIKAFPDYNRLHKMVEYGLKDIDWHSITSNTNLGETVYKLIQTAESVGKLCQLIYCASSYNPNNPELKKWMEKYEEEIQKLATEEEYLKGEFTSSEPVDRDPKNESPVRSRFVFWIVHILCWLPLSAYIVWGTEYPSTKSLMMSLASLIIIAIGCFFTNRSSHIERQPKPFALAIVVIGLGTIAGALNSLFCSIAGAVTGVIALKIARFLSQRNELRSTENEKNFV